MKPLDLPRYRTELRRLALVWSLLCAVGATAGAVAALLQREDGQP